MKRALDVLLGIVSLEPLLFFAVFFLWLLPAFGRQPRGVTTSLFRERFDTLVPFAILSSLALIALLLVYVAILARRADLSIAEKIGVPLGILLTNGIVLPLVWWFYIWRRSSLFDARAYRADLQRRSTPLL